MANIIVGLAALGLLVAGCGGATDSCGDSKDGNTDNIHEVVRVDNGDPDTATDNLIVVCENGKMIPGP